MQDLHAKYHNVWQRMMTPLEHLPDCQGVHYRLQLNAYRYILEKYYGRRVSAMRVVCTHPDNGDQAFVDEVPVMQEEVEAMMHVQRLRSREIRNMARNDFAAFDPLGGSASQEYDFEAAIEESCRDDDVESAHAATAFAALMVDECPGTGAASSTLPPPPTEPPVTGIALGSQEDALPQCPDAATRMASKKRRLLPGAAESSANFRAMFAEMESAAAASLGGVVAERVDPRSSILGRTARIMTHIQETYPAWDDSRVRLVCGALCMYRMRLVDLFMREHVMLVWIIEGGHRLRVHKGVCYMYNECGAFDAYKGTPPECTFFRVKEFLLCLEGLFRLLPRDLSRDDRSVLTAIAASMDEFESDEAYLHKCMDAAIFCLGSRRGRRGRSREGGEADAGDLDVAPAEEAPVHWNVITAENISRLGLQIQKELMGERLIAYIVEWCETPDVRRPGVAYQDTCIAYDTDGDNTKNIRKSPSNNVYMRVPHALLDPVGMDAANSLLRFYEQTFWCNQPVFACFQAAQALAKRGENLDRCFIGLSPGGECV